MKAPQHKPFRELNSQQGNIMFDSFTTQRDLQFEVMYDTLMNIVPPMMQDKNNDWSEDLEDLKGVCPEFFISGPSLSEKSKRESEMTEEDIIEKFKRWAPDKFHLRKVDYRDEMSLDDIEDYIRGEAEGPPTDIEDWVDENYTPVYEVLDEFRATLEKDQCFSTKTFNDVMTSLCLIIRERDVSQWAEDLLKQTPSPIFRARAGYRRWFRTWDFLPELHNGDLCEAIGLDYEKNKEVLWELESDCYHYRYYETQWIFSLESLEKIYTASEFLVVTNPYLWLNNPYYGRGWATQVKGEIKIPRQDICLDRFYGNSYEEVFDAVPDSVKCASSILSAS